MTPGATLSVTSLAFANTLVGSSSAAGTVTLTNSGNATLSVTSITLTGANPTDFTIGTGTNACATSPLPASASCTIYISFNPLATGAFTANLSIVDNATGSPQTVTLTGTGVVPIASLSASSLAFPNTLAMPVTASSPLTVTLNNTGTGLMTIGGIAVSGSSTFTQTNTCGTTLAPAASCTVSVTFTPIANVAVSYTGTLSFTDNSSAGSPQTVALTGTGVIPVASISPTTLAFPNTGVGSTAVAMSTTLTNTGGGVMGISGITIVGTNPTDFGYVTTCGATLAPAASCTISVTFTPATATSFSANLQISDTAAGSPQLVALTGTGVVSVASLSPSSLTFPTTPVGTTSAQLSTVLTNSGGLAMSISSITLGGQNPTDFHIASTTCGATLAANGGTCIIYVAFAPLTATPVTMTASILIADNAAGSPQSVALSGTVTPPTASLTPTSLSFPFTDINTTSAAMSATIQNTGTGTPLIVTALSMAGGNTADFAVTSACGTLPVTVAVNTSCTINVTFSPLAAGTFSSTVSITDNAANSPQSITVTGTAATPTLTIGPTSCAFPTTDVGSASAACVVTITSTGNGPDIFSGFTFSGANPSNFAISANTCSGTQLQPLAACTVSVTFTPTAVANYTANLTIADNVTGSPQTVTLAGSGGIPAVSLSPTTLNFLSNLTGSTETLTSTLTNTGTGPLTVNSLTLTGTNKSLFSIAGSCSGIILAGSTCPISVNFTPTSVGSFTASVSIADNAAGSPQSISLLGSGAAEVNSCKTVNDTSPAQSAPTPNYAGTAFSGKVLSGTTAVIGASVQVYAAGSTGNGSTPTALGTALVTDSNGAFSVPATYTCPYNNSVLYAIARGGKAGATGTVNAGIVLAAVLGTCNSITGSPTFTLNEVTTAVTAWSMAQFLAAGGKIGATSTNSIGSNNTPGIVLAAGTFANLVNPLSGSIPGTYFPSTGTAPAARINQLANLLHTCIVSTGATSSSCTQLYSLTATTALTPSNTLDAAMNLVLNPGTNVAALYSLSTGSVAFTPSLTAAPADWTLFVNYTGGGMDDPSAVSVDSTGRVWVANYFSVASFFTNTGTPVFPSGITGDNLLNSYGGAVDVNDVMWIANEESGYSLNGGLGTVTLLNSSGASLATYTAGGLNFPIAVAFDTSGISWIVNYGDSEMTVLTNSGTVISGPTGYSSYQFEFPVAAATDGKCNAYLANQSSDTITYNSADGSTYGSFALGSGPSGIAVDASNYIWEASYYGNSVGLLSSTGTILSGAGYTGGGIDHPQGVAIDGAGSAWVANYRSTAGVGDALTQLAGSTTANPGSALSPATGWATDAGMLESFGLAIDAAGSVWVTGFGNNTLTQIVGIAVPVKTPLLGPVRVP